MLLAHFLKGESGDPAWLRFVGDVGDGRAAPLFCLVLGVGSGLYLRRRDPLGLVRRGLVLGVLGVAIWPLVDRIYLILPHYGLLLVIVAACSRLPTGWLLPMGVTCWALPSIVVSVVDGHGLQAAEQPSSHAELLDVPHLLWQLVWSGGYPLVGWTGFALVGLWLARRDLGDASVAKRMVVVGVAAGATQLLSVALRSAAAPGSETFWDSTAHSNQLAWYVAATGSSLAVLGLCLLSGRVAAARPFALLGSQALSLYLLHIVIGAVIFWPWRDRVAPELGLQLLVVAGVAVALWAVAAAWTHRFGIGPLERALRHLAR
jgi:uncharacterized membrane protein YeiB